MVLAEDSVLQPDLLVVRDEEFRDESLPVRPLLAVEIMSPSTRHLDVTLKLVRYEAARCPSYWVVDPDERSLTVWQLEGGKYVEHARVTGDETCTLSRPFELTITPSRLINDRRD